MSKTYLPRKFVQLCKSIKPKRPKTVIKHILKHGYITTQELKDLYGYNHPPRAARDVREQGIPLETFRVTGRDGRKIAAYRFGKASKARHGTQKGRSVLGQKLKQQLIAQHGERCMIYLQPFPARELQVDHRIPFEVHGDALDKKPVPEDYMLLSGSANRAKSWSCEHCLNWMELKKPEICKKCYWAYPDNYTHVAMREVRRADILWTEGEVPSYERLKQRTLELQKDIPGYVKEIIEQHLKNAGE